MRRLRGIVLIGVVVLAQVLTGCGENTERDASSQPQGASLRVTLGTPDFPEARLMGELWKQALAVNGYAVDLRKGIGPAADLDAALRAGEIDGHVAYTGTVLSVVAGEEVSGLDPEETLRRARAYYESQDMFLSDSTPFENKDAVAVTPQFAAENDLRTIADLAALESFTLGARPEFAELYLGVLGLEDLYGLDNIEFASVPLGEQYAALDAGEVDAVDAYTTDPALGDGDYVLLEDPEQLFGAQNVALAVSQDKLERIDSDRFLQIVAAVNDELTEDVVIALNGEITDGRDEADVAREFLRDVGLATPLRE